MPYNPFIAGAFFRSGQIEAWGRGVEKITLACQSWGKPEPFYRIRSNEVMIGFDAAVAIGEKFGENGTSIVENGKNIVENIVENGDSIVEKRTQDKIIALMLAKPTISAKAIAVEIGIASRNVQNHIQTLKLKGLVERIGPAKGGYWLVKNGRSDDVF